MSSRALDSSNFLAQNGLTFFPDWTQASGQAPRRPTDHIQSSSLRSSTSGEVTPSSYLAFPRPSIETHSRHTNLEYRLPSLRMFRGSAKRRLPCRSNGNGYVIVEAPKSGNRSLLTRPPPEFGNRSHSIEEFIERAIFDCRFFTLMAIVGSLAGSLLCFFKGCGVVGQSFSEYIHASLNGFDTGQVILLLLEAVDIYLMGTVLLIFGMGLYELFVSNIAIPTADSASVYPKRKNFTSNLFGLFQLRKRPLWLEIQSLDELKTKLGHMIVIILMVAMFEKSRNVAVTSVIDLFCFSASIFMSSGCLFLLSKLNSFK